MHTKSKRSPLRMDEEAFFQEVDSKMYSSELDLFMEDQSNPLTTIVQLFTGYKSPYEQLFHQEGQSYSEWELDSLIDQWVMERVDYIRDLEAKRRFILCSGMYHTLVAFPYKYVGSDKGTMPVVIGLALDLLTYESDVTLRKYENEIY